MGDAIIFVCGPYANLIFSCAKDGVTAPYHIVSSKDSTLHCEDPDTIRTAMEGYRVVMLFCVFGEEESNVIGKTVIQCARDVGCKVVTVFGIPFEPIGHAKAFALEPEIESISDCTMIFDMDAVTTAFNDRKAYYFLNMASRAIAFGLNNLAEYVDGPFFSTFTEKRYSFSYQTEVLPINAVRNAFGSILSRAQQTGDIIIMVSSRIRQSEIDDLSNTVAMEYGLMPKVVCRSDSEDTKVLMFMSVGSL